MMHLPALGIHGNSHMLMQDRNSNERPSPTLTQIVERYNPGP
jgi:hypothetical protein